MAYDLTMGGLYAVIPAGVLYDDRLRPAAKLLYGEIVRLAQSSGYCYATNKQLMGVCNLTDKSVSELVSQLRDCGHIRVEMIRRFGASGDVVQRRIFLGQILAKNGPQIQGEEVHGGIPKNPDTSPEKSGEGIPKNPEEYRGIKNTSIYPPIPPMGVSQDATFDAFWDIYPKHKDKQKARRAWAKIKPDAALLEIILRAVKAQAASEDWTRDGGRYVPYPSTWLNGRRWEDETPGRSESDQGGYSREADDTDGI